jgi:predicted secreted hydrolase
VRIAHFAITDVDKQVQVADQRAALGPGQAPPVDGFDFDVRGWRAAGSGGDDHLIAQAGEYTLDLDFDSAKRPVLHGGTGSLDVSTAGQSSYYYSRTRMRARGTISTGADTMEVSGLAWFDHQWGNFSAPAIGWDWLALQLDDRSEVMLYRIRDLSTGDEFDYGTFVDPEGRASELANGDFEISSLDTWISPVTGAEYPSGWTVEIPSRGIRLEATTLVEASEFDARATTRNVYWEGLVRLTGSHSGWGFVELVGYGAPATAPR